MIVIAKRNFIYSAAILALCAGYSAPAYAQATRTWVSGVGDDVNPCSRTAPCKTFAGAISKTAAGGEINCLDPGGFGAVTINKSLVIDCHYTEGGVLAGGNGIVVNGLSTDVIVLRGLDIFGVNPPSNGVRFIAGGALHIEDCVIRRFNAANSFGISFAPSATSFLFLSNTTITQNGNGSTGGGINVQPTGTGVARVMINNTSVHGNANAGLIVNSTGLTGAGIAVVVEHSEFSGNGFGISFLAPLGTTNQSGQVTNSTIAHNSAAGISADGSGVTLRVGNTTIAGNAFASGAGVQILNSAKILTYLDNRVEFNGVDGAFTAPSIPKK
jgi:hypothetical protein